MKNIPVSQIKTTFFITHVNIKSKTKENNITEQQFHSFSYNTTRTGQKNLAKDR